MSQEFRRKKKEWSLGISDIEGKAARVAASEWTRRAVGDIDGETERSRWAGAHESMRATSEFQSSERDERHERQSRERSGDRGGSRGNQNRVACARVLPLIKAIPQTGCNHCVR